MYEPMIEFENDTHQQYNFAQANPSPVLSSRADGVLQFVNQAALKLMLDLKLEIVDDLLPVDHEGLVMACLKTGVTLSEERQLNNRNIVWSYQPTNDSDIVYIYGYDVTAYQPKDTNLKCLPEANPNPVLIYKKGGTIHFSNIAVSMLLNDLELENVEDVLPVNHRELLSVCLNTRTPVAGDRQACDHCIVWSYQLSDSGEVIYVYGCDVSQHQPKDFSADDLPGVNPNPVLTSGPDGTLRYSNYATSLLLLDLELDNVEDMLPQDHKGMVKACHATNTPLTAQHKIGERKLVWSYHPVDASDVIYIYGHDITDYCSNTFGKEG